MSALLFAGITGSNLVSEPLDWGRKDTRIEAQMLAIESRTKAGVCVLVERTRKRLFHLGL